MMVAIGRRFARDRCSPTNIVRAASRSSFPLLSVRSEQSFGAVNGPQTVAFICDETGNLTHVVGYGGADDTETETDEGEEA